MSREKTEQLAIKKMEAFLKKAFGVNGTCKFVESKGHSSKYEIKDVLKGIYYITLSDK